MVIKIDKCGYICFKFLSKVMNMTIISQKIEFNYQKETNSFQKMD
jgi:hypothetical protein